MTIKTEDLKLSRQYIIYDIFIIVFLIERVEFKVWFKSILYKLELLGLRVQIVFNLFDMEVIHGFNTLFYVFMIKCE